MRCSYNFRFINLAWVPRIHLALIEIHVDETGLIKMETKKKKKKALSLLPTPNSFKAFSDCSFSAHKKKKEKKEKVRGH